MEARIAELEQQVTDFQARLDQTSSNSPKPPSSDGPIGHPKHERAILSPTR